MTTGSLSIFEAARDAGDRVALRTGGRAWTFTELAARVRPRFDALAAHPRDGTPVALVADNSPETAVELYALLAAGIPAVLLHPRLTASEREQRLAAITRSGRVPHRGAAAVLYTSGTTGEPRGAVLTRSAFLASAEASANNLGWQDDDCWLLAMPLAHVGGLSILTRCLLARRAVALASRFDAAALPELIATERVTLASLVPTMLARLLDDRPDWIPPAHLRAVLLGGAAASPRLLASASARRVPVLVTYGLTEACSQVTTTRYETRFAPAGEGSGEPLPGTEVRIVDGRIQVRGPTLMAGYWNEPPLAPGEWFDTGDLGELDGRGRLHVHARRTDLIVTGGENVYPVEVEGVLEECPGVAAAAVFGIPDERWGQVVAAALVAGGTAPSDTTLAAFVIERLAPHKRPRRICYVGALPQTPSGKLDRSALAQFAPGLRSL